MSIILATGPNKRHWIMCVHALVDMHIYEKDLAWGGNKFTGNNFTSHNYIGHNYIGGYNSI